MEVTLIDSMGTDLTVANAARVSFNKESEWEVPLVYDEEAYGYLDGEKQLSEKDTKLIKYLATHNHWTPFSHCMITMREKVPIFVARQRFKHTIGFSYNEVSRRYVDDTPEFYIPKEWRGKPLNAKQGSSDEVIEDLICHITKDRISSVSQKYRELLAYCEDVYNDMIFSGVAPEQARMVLPQSMYTEYYCSGSLAAWARAYKLRIDAHAQKEIRDVAVEWDKVIRPLFPVSWSTLVD